jgi:hypothetical protein
MPVILDTWEVETGWIMVWGQPRQTVLETSICKITRAKVDCKCGLSPKPWVQNPAPPKINKAKLNDPKELLTNSLRVDKNWGNIFSVPFKNYVSWKNDTCSKLDAVQMPVLLWKVNSFYNLIHVPSSLTRNNYLSILAPNTCSTFSILFKCVHFCLGQLWPH